MNRRISRFLVLVVAIMMCAFAVSALAVGENNAFDLHVEQVEVPDNRFAGEGGNVAYKVSYHLPYEKDFAQAVEGVTSFRMSITTENIENIVLVKAFTLVCTDTTCTPHDDVEFLNFDSSSGTVEMTYGYSGDMTFVASVKDAGSVKVSVAVVYGDNLYSESVSLTFDDFYGETPAPTTEPTTSPETEATPTADESMTPTATPGTDVENPTTGDEALTFVYAAVMLMVAGFIGFKMYDSRKTN